MHELQEGEEVSAPSGIYFPLLFHPMGICQLLSLLTWNSRLFLHKYFKFRHFCTGESRFSCCGAESTKRAAYWLVSAYHSDISVPKTQRLHALSNHALSFL